MDKQQKRILTIMALLCAAVLVTVCVLFALRSKPIRQDFTPPPFEPQALTGIPPEMESEASYGRMTVNPGFSFCLCAKPTLTDHALSLYVTAPEDNTVWILARIYDEAGILLGQSGLLRPGEYCEAIALSAIPPQGATLTVKVLSYEPDTYYSRGSAQAILTVSRAS